MHFEEYYKRRGYVPRRFSVYSDRTRLESLKQIGDNLRRRHAETIKNALKASIFKRRRHAYRYSRPTTKEYQIICETIADEAQKCLQNKFQNEMQVSTVNSDILLHPESTDKHIKSPLEIQCTFNFLLHNKVPPNCIIKNKMHSHLI